MKESCFLPVEFYETACCPNCGGDENKLAIMEDDDLWFVLCTGCDEEGPSAVGRIGAVKAWNKKMEGRRP